MLQWPDFVDCRTATCRREMYCSECSFNRRRLHWKLKRAPSFVPSRPGAREAHSGSPARLIARKYYSLAEALFSDELAANDSILFTNVNVLIGWQVRKAVDLLTGPRPVNFNLINLGRSANAEHLARIMGR